uniref:Uncharacterized protein n=1 Tax=Picea glauca TaxID=3330 RepID=A0A101M3S6_PICGL|nr:hypothetical protein ABT39_MTgene374 [Picea glauca]QHR86492.1 hypothetical protein Q903MT_gene494 [Picea sitchensis]
MGGRVKTWVGETFLSGTFIRCQHTGWGLDTNLLPANSNRQRFTFHSMSTDRSGGSIGLSWQCFLNPSIVSGRSLPQLEKDRAATTIQLCHPAIGGAWEQVWFDRMT